MNYKELCDVYENIENTTKGLEKTSILATFLEKIIETPWYIYLLQGKAFADYDTRELGISEQLMIKALSKTTGRPDKEILEEYKRTGDLGLVAEHIIQTKKQQQALFNTTLTLRKVYENLTKIPTFEGKGTIEHKLQYIIELLHNATPKEAKYLTRTTLGDLKIGIGNGILRDAIVEQHYKPTNIQEKKIYAEKIQEAYNKTNDFAEVLERTNNNTLQEIKLRPGTPIKVMLFPKAKNIEEAFRIIGKPAAFEYKYDGFRMMINKEESGNITLYTRRLEDVTKQFPDITTIINKYIKGKSYMIDCEIVGYNKTTGTYTEFQAISQRIRRKHGIQKMAEELPVELVLFDIIYYNKKDLIQKPFKKRRTLLKEITTQKEKKIILAKQIITEKETEVEEFYKQALKEKQEGLMGKNLEAPYKPGARIGHAIKLKPEDKELDLIITGGEWGTGKRKGWITSYNLACKGENDELLNIGNVGSGLKEIEEQGLSYKKLTEIIKPHITKEEGRSITIKPTIVVSVQYQNIQESNNYNSGYALRFPRIKRLRPDRGTQDITTIKEIKEENNN